MALTNAEGRVVLTPQQKRRKTKQSTPKTKQSTPKTVTRGTAQAFSRSRARSPSGEASGKLLEAVGFSDDERRGTGRGTGHRGDERDPQVRMADKMYLDRLEERQRAEQYGAPFLTYNEPLPGQTKQYGTDQRLNFEGVRFKNPENLPVPKELKQTIYAAMAKVPYFAQYLSNVKGEKQGKIEFVLGSSKNDVGTYFGITIPDLLQGGETLGIYSESHTPLTDKYSIHVVIPREVFFEYQRGMATAQKAKARGSKLWKDVYKAAVESFKLRANDVLLHEVGHHVDRTMDKLSETKEWREIYGDPVSRQSEGPYGASASSELFAGAFKEYVDSPESRESMDPRIRAFMDKYISPLLPQTTEEHPKKTAGYARELTRRVVKRYVDILKVYRMSGPDIETIDSRVF